MKELIITRETLKNTIFNVDAPRPYTITPTSAEVEAFGDWCKDEENEGMKHTAQEFGRFICGSTEYETTPTIKPIPEDLKLILAENFSEHYINGTEPFSVLLHSEIVEYYTKQGQDTEQALDSAEAISPDINRGIMQIILKGIENL